MAFYRRGTTPDGHDVTASGSAYDPEVTIDGERVTVIGRPTLYRDGGTWVIPTSRGTVTFPNRLGSDDRTPRLRTGPEQP